MSKTVLVTGTSSGFGRDTVKHFAAQGWNVAATMRNVKDAGELAELPNVLVTALDVQDRPSIDAAIAATLARFGRIDAVVNNAGFGLWGTFEETPREKLIEQFDVNVFGLMDVTRAVLPHLRAQRSGTIVNITSGVGVFTLPMISLYAASKFAVEGWSESLAFELAPLGIRVKLVEPGGVVTTKFGARSASEAGAQSSIPDYADFTQSTAALFDRMRASPALQTSTDVAAAIYRATIDESEQLRYVATRDIEELVRLRRETSEDEYMRAIRAIVRG